MYRSNLFSVVRGLCFFATDEAGGAAPVAPEAAPAAPTASVGATAAPKAKATKKPASKPAKKAKKAPAKKAKAAPKKKAKAAKGAKKAKASGDGKLNAKQQKVVDYLGKHNANVADRAIKREKVFNACGVGFGVIASLKDKGLLERVDEENGTKSYKLTASGSKAVTKK